MKRLTTSDWVGAWVFNMLGDDTWHPKGRACVGEHDQEGVCWGVVYERYQLVSIHAHIAVRHPSFLTRRSLEIMFYYPFVELGVERIIAEVNSGNLKAVKLLPRMGFTQEAVIKGVYSTGDMLVFSIDAAACPWLRGQDNGQRKRRTDSTITG